MLSWCWYWLILISATSNNEWKQLHYIVMIQCNKFSLTQLVHWNLDLILCRLVQNNVRHGRLLNQVEIPVDTEARGLRRKGVAVAHLQARARDAVQLRDVFQRQRVGDGTRQRDVQLHQKVRGHRHVEGFGKVRRLEPRRDAANAGDVHLCVVNKCVCEIEKKMKNETMMMMMMMTMIK